MSRLHRSAKPFLAVAIVGAVALVVAGCGAIFVPGSLKGEQPAGIGSVGIHFKFCTLAGDFVTSEEFACGPNTENGQVRYVIGIAVPAGSTPPQTFTANPLGSGPPIVFTRDDGVAREIAAGSAAEQHTLAEFESENFLSPEALETLRGVVGSTWPPSGLQGVGYVSAPFSEVAGTSAEEWSVDTEFGLPGGPAPYVGPFEAAVAIGFPEHGGEPVNGPAHCRRIEEGVTTEPGTGELFCTGTIQQIKVGTSDLRVGVPAQPAQAFVGGQTQVSFPIQYGGTAATVPTFVLGATTTAPGATVTPGTFAPGAPDPTSHLSPAGTGEVTVSVPKSVKPGTYAVTLTATAPQGGVVSQTGSLQVTRPKLKFGALKRNRKKGTATLKIKVPSAGRLKIAGKGVARVKKKANKAKTLKVKIRATGKVAKKLKRTGRAKLKLRATFKPSSGISVSKKKRVVLKRR
jgi:hypothetical protein